jgi:hypothetical protein
VRPGAPRADGEFDYGSTAEDHDHRAGEKQGPRKQACR